MFLVFFILSESLRFQRLCVRIFNAEAAEIAELRREFESGAPRLGRSSLRVGKPPVPACYALSALFEAAGNHISPVPFVYRGILLLH